MEKIIEIKDLNKLQAFLKKKNKEIILTGGCFDILHFGHIKFLQELKKRNSLLVLLLESDKKVSLLKGANRPIFRQEERARMLSSLTIVDFVILLPYMEKDEDYKKVVETIQPDVIALTEKDPLTIQKENQAKSIKAKLHIVSHKKTYSSSKLAEIIGLD